MATRIQVVIDCVDPARLAQFWAAALGYQVQPPPPGYSSWPEFLTANGIPESDHNGASAVVDPDGNGPRVFLQRVPEPKSGKNRLHLDLSVGGGRGTPAEERHARIHAEARRLAGLGASIVGPCEPNPLGEYWVVMRDPEGNEFCLH